MISLLVATGNRNKMREFKRLLRPGFSLHDLGAHPEIGEIAEDGTTLEANARLKATAVSRQVRGWVLADDSGLEVDSLGGQPGVRSARFAGERASDVENRARLLHELARLPKTASRVARFRCVLALARSGEVVATFEGIVEGKIAASERGARGFGYDSLFCPSGRYETFAELSIEEKDRLSHRGAAVKRLRRFFRSL
jgi:XTP/dITP diphosphohydrolase